MKKNETFPIVEIFKSIEGEGSRVGAPTTFVRFGQCNLSCAWCDTQYAMDQTEITYMSKESIASEILRLHCTNVTFTGGEPLYQGHNFISWFCNAYPEFQVNIETNGSIVLDRVKYPGVMFTMDYKCPSSGMNDKMVKSNFSVLGLADSLKFVVANDLDLREVVNVLMEYRPVCKIFINPVYGKMSLANLAKFVIDHDFLNMRLGFQFHKIIWDPSIRGV